MSIVHVEFAIFRSSGAVCEDDESNEFGIIRGVSWKNCVSPIVNTLRSTAIRSKYEAAK